MIAKRLRMANLAKSLPAVSLLLILLLLVSGVRPTYADSSATRVLPQLQAMAAKEPNKNFRVIVSRVNKRADEKVKALGGIKLKEVAAEAFVANIKGGMIASLGKDPAIKYVSLDAQMIKTGTFVDASKVATLYPHVVRASNLWSGTAPITGAGISVAVLDTGISDRADWKPPTGGNRIAAKVLFNSSVETKFDGHGHGTHVAGIIGGNSWGQSDTALKGKYIGIAPEARLLNVRVSDDFGVSFTSDVVNAIDWVISTRQTYNTRVMNLSLISSVAESATTSILAAAVERAWFNGIFVVVAAGNSGHDTMYYPPANDPFVITVGASDSVGTIARTDDVMAPWSSYGTTQDGYNKPDAAAPGRYIISTRGSASSTLATLYPDRIVDGSYMWLSGTSMAAPVVAGIAALAFEAKPQLTNDQLKWLLMKTATRLGGGTEVLGQGAGLVDAIEVIRYSQEPGFANQRLAINQNLVTADGSTTYTSANWSTANWSTANWSTANWSTANWSTANWSTANWSTANFTMINEADIE